MSRMISDGGNFPVISEEEIREAMQEVERDGVAGLVQYLEEKEENWKTVPLNIAVFGNSGVGKSSFINAIRGLTADDEGAAAVGVTETTTSIKSYTYPRNPLMVFWDLPGVGSRKFPKETYLKQIEVERYDFFLLMSKTRFTEIDAWLGKEVKKLGKKYFYVRTHIAADVSNNRLDYPRTHNAEKVISDIRRKSIAELEDDETPVFLIENRDTSLYDFNNLEQRLVEDFPELKKSALVLSMIASSEKIVELKVAELRKRIWRSALLSSAMSAVPVPGVSLAFDLACVHRTAESYKSQLGLDEKSLERLAERNGIDLKALIAILAQSGILCLTIKSLQILAQSMPAVVYSTAVEEFSRFLPFVGFLIAAPLLFGGTYYMLKVLLDQMEEAAKKIVRLASEREREW